MTTQEIINRLKWTMIQAAGGAFAGMVVPSFDVLQGAVYAAITSGIAFITLVARDKLGAATG